MLRLSLSAAGTYTQAGHEEHCPDINGPACAEDPVAAEWHDVKLLFTDIRLAADLGVTDWLAVELLWSLRVVDIKFELQDLDPALNMKMHLVNNVRSPAPSLPRSGLQILAN